MTAKMENMLISIRNDFITKQERNGCKTKVRKHERNLRKFCNFQWYQTDYSLITKTKNGKVVRVYVTVEEEGGED